MWKFYIFDIIKDMQIFLTTPNESAILPEIKGKLLRIDGGKITDVSSHWE